MTLIDNFLFSVFKSLIIGFLIGGLLGLGFFHIHYLIHFWKGNRALKKGNYELALVEYSDAEVCRLWFLKDNTKLLEKMDLCIKSIIEEHEKKFDFKYGKNP